MPYSLKRLTFAIRRVSRRLSPISSIRWRMVASDGRCFIWNVLQKYSGSSSVSCMAPKSALPQRIPISIDFRMSLFEYSLDGGVCLSTLRSKSMAESICPGISRPPYGVTRLLLNEKLSLVIA